MILPLGFARVDENVYRSGYPAKKSLDFIGTLGLKSMVSLLNPSENRSDLKAHCKAHDIFLFEADIGVNKEPFLSMNAEVVTAVLKHLDNRSNLPCLLFCSNGKLRTSCMIGCYRKTRGWSMASILEEVEMYCESEGDVLDALFIDNFRLTPTVVDPACAAVYGMEGTETRT